MNNQDLRNEIENKVAEIIEAMRAEAKQWELSPRNHAWLKLNSGVLNIHGRIAAFRIIAAEARKSSEALKKDRWAGTASAKADRDREELALIMGW